MKVRLRKWNAVAVWKWDVLRLGAKKEDVCSICHFQLDSTCHKCEYPGSHCGIVIGECHHVLHIHCLEKCSSDSESNKKRCPECRQDFMPLLSSGPIKPDSFSDEESNSTSGGSSSEGSDSNDTTEESPDSSDNDDEN